MRARPVRLLWALRFLVGAIFVYLPIPTRLDDPAWWPLSALACAALVTLGAWVAIATRETRAFSWRELVRIPDSLEANLAVLAAIGLTVKAATPVWPLAPLLIFLFLPISIFPSRRALLWIPAALLAAMAVGPLLLERDFTRLAWAAAFALFSFGFLKGSSERERYRKMAEDHRVLQEDTAQLRQWIRDKDQPLRHDHHEMEKTFENMVVQDTDKLLGDLARWAVETFAARTALILVPSGEGRFRLRYGGGRNVALMDHPIPSDKGFLNHALLRDDGLLLVNDARAAAGSLAFYPPGVEVGSLAVKVVFEKRKEGSPPTGARQPHFAIYLDRTTTDGFAETAELKRKLESFARLVDRTLDVVEDMGRVLSRYKSSESIANLAGRLTATLDSKVMAEHALASLGESMPDCEDAAFLLGAGPVTVECIRGDAFAGMEGAEVSTNEPSLIGHLLRLVTAAVQGAAPARAEIVQNNIEKGRRVHLLLAKETVGRVASFAALPCRVRQTTGTRLVGVLVAASPRPGFFSEERLKVLRTLTDITAPALDNAFTHRERDELSRIDGLTELLNHRTFQNVFESKVQMVDREYYSSLAVIMADADHFKKVNDTHGHSVGDQVLRELARRLRTGIRKNDTVARYGGEEFVILLDKTDWAEAGSITEKLRRSVEEAPFDTQAGPLKVTVSMGYCVYARGDNATRQQLLDRADQALYAAKRSGRNRVVAHREVAGEPSISR